MPFRLGGPELVIILFVVMMIFGVGRLPQVGSTIGKAMKEFRKAQFAESDDEPSEDPPDIVPKSLTDTRADRHDTTT